MTPENASDSVEISRAGKLVWGVAKHVFCPTGAFVSVYIDANEDSISSTWKTRFSCLESQWDALRPELNATLPGGLAASILRGVDFRGHLASSIAVLHFASSSDSYDWYVRLNSEWHIEAAGPCD